MIDLKDLTVDELENLAEDLVDKRFPGRQLFTWIHRQNVTDFSGMTNLSKEFRSLLSDRHIVGRAEIEQVQTSELDGTRKLLLRLADGQRIETVWIPSTSRSTICVSSQVGCALGCRFCFTGKMKFRRDLTAGEIVEQIYSIRSILAPDEDFKNIVYMGMGEPFLNYDNVLKSVEMLMSDYGLGIAQKRITVSTVGVIPGIYRLADSGLKIMLAVSLHAATDELRNSIVPANKKYPLKDLFPALKHYTERTGERLTFEYCLIGGINDSIECAKDLVKFIHDIPCKINLISYNPAPGMPKEFKRPTADSVENFKEYLYPRCPAVTIRKSRGADILAACGQLATHGPDSQKTD